MSTDERSVNPSRFVWLDAYEAEGEWYGTDYVPEVRPMTTYGYAIAITDKYISVASTYDPDTEQYACVINIPIGMLITVTPVSVRNETIFESEQANIETPHQCKQNLWQPRG